MTYVIPIIEDLTPHLIFIEYLAPHLILYDEVPTVEEMAGIVNNVVCFAALAEK